jgi:hypothetical protein
MNALNRDMLHTQVVEMCCMCMLLFAINGKHWNYTTSTLLRLLRVIVVKRQLSDFSAISWPISFQWRCGIFQRQFHTHKRHISSTWSSHCSTHKRHISSTWHSHCSTHQRHISSTWHSHYSTHQRHISSTWQFSNGNFTGRTSSVWAKY